MEHLDSMGVAGMGQLPEWAQRWRGRWKGSRLDRGATLVEYALIASLVLVGSLAAIDQLNTAAREETDRQIDCVAERPPRASCQVPAIVTTTTAEPPSTPTSADEPEPPQPEFVISDTDSQDLGDGNWQASVTFDLVGGDTDDLPGLPIEGAIIRFTWTVPGFPPVVAECVTDSNGSCSSTFIPTGLSPAAGTVQIQIQNVFNVDPPLLSYPSPETVSAP